jgi:hypothetical protein
VGIDRLVDALVELGDAKRAVTAKTIVDIRRAGASIAAVTGVTGEGIGFEPQWETARSEVVTGLVDMVVATDVAEKAEVEGAALALRTGVGPIGLIITRIRDTRLARAFGLSPRGSLASEAAQEWASRPGRDKALGTLESLVSQVAFAAGGPYAKAIRSQFDAERLTDGVDQTVDLALHRAGQAKLAGRPWWAAIAAIKWLLAIAVIWGGVWWYASPPVRGSVPWSVVLVVGGLVLGLGSSRLLDVSGRKLGRSRIDDFRQQMAADLDSQLERVLGQPLRAAVRERAELGAVLAQIFVEAERAQQSA